MAVLKRYIIIAIFASMFGIVSTYAFVELLIYKANNEVKQLSNIAYSIRSLQDVHSLCMLDYRYHPKNIEHLQDCRKVETDITSQLTKYKEETPYLDFYKKYFNENKL